MTGALIGSDYENGSGAILAPSLLESAEVACGRITDFQSSTGFIYAHKDDDGSCAASASFPAVLDPGATEQVCPATPQVICASPFDALPYMCQCAKYLPTSTSASTAAYVTVSATISAQEAGVLRTLQHSHEHGLNFALVRDRLARQLQIEPLKVHVTGAARTDDSYDKFLVTATVAAFTDSEAEDVHRRASRKPVYSKDPGVSFTRSAIVANPSNTEASAVTTGGQVNAATKSGSGKTGSGLPVILAAAGVAIVCVALVAGFLVRRRRMNRMETVVKPMPALAVNRHETESLQPETNHSD